MGSKEVPQTFMKHYDYIVAGAGAAGLSLIMHLIDSGKFTGKSILIVERSPKNVNDRTWCFWETTPGLFDSIVQKKWHSMWFYGVDGVSKRYDISPFEYKMIRGIDYYNYCFDQISKQPNISLVYGDISDLQSSAGTASMEVNGEKFLATYIFSSLPMQIPAGEKNYFLWQHFKGWVIQTNKAGFDPNTATLMDFRIRQYDDCRFVYVMPLSHNQALVEYTGFSESRLNDEAYDAELADYCLNFLQLAAGDYEIQSAEFGMIPMTCFDFPRNNGNIIYIGTAGGQTKPSSGYTFNFIQKHSKKIVDCLVAGTRPVVRVSDRRFRFYDSILLRILTQRKLKGANIFTTLFMKNEMTEVFKFLDNDTSLLEDISIIKTLPTLQFLEAAVGHLMPEKGQA